MLKLKHRVYIYSNNIIKKFEFNSLKYIIYSQNMTRVLYERCYNAPIQEKLVFVVAFIMIQIQLIQQNGFLDKKTFANNP